MKNGPPTLCCEPRCDRLRRKDRRRCHMHDQRRKRAADPIYAAWRNLKDSAKRRCIEFRLSLKYFTKFALQTQYLTRKGPYGGCLTVDRKNNLRGYVAGNIQPLTRSENTRKQAKRDAIRLQKGYSWQENY